MCRSDGSLFVHSFAHGKSFYTLKYDAAAVEAAIKAADADAAMKTLVRLDPQAELDGVELDRLIELVVKREKVKIRTVKATPKEASAQAAAAAQKEAAERVLSERTDPRPRIEQPRTDAPWREVNGTLNGSTGTSDKPPRRNVDGGVARSRLTKTPSFHAFSSANED